MSEPLFLPDPTPSGLDQAPCSNPEPHDPHVWQRGYAVSASAVIDQSPIHRCPGVPDIKDHGDDQTEIIAHLDT